MWHTYGEVPLRTVAEVLGSNSLDVQTVRMGTVAGTILCHQRGIGALTDS